MIWIGATVVVGRAIDARLLLVVLPSQLLVFATILLSRKHVESASCEAQERQTDLSGAVHELVTGARDAQAHGVRVFLQSRLRRAAEANCRAAVRRLLINEAVSSVSTWAMGAAYCISIGAACLLAVKQDITVGEVVAFGGYTNQLLRPTAAVIPLIISLQSAGVAAGRLLTHLCEEIVPRKGRTRRAACAPRRLSSGGCLSATWWGNQSSATYPCNSDLGA